MLARIAIAVGLSLMLRATASAESIEFSSSVRRVTALEASDGAPSGGIVYEHYVTTDGDILSVSFVETEELDGEMYDHPLSSPGQAPHPTLFDFFPSLSADSYISTPGSTFVLGGGLVADGDDAFGDVSDDGPQSDYQFAQFTFPSGSGVKFTGKVSIAGTSAVYSEEFSFLDFPIVQHAYLDSYPADESEISLSPAIAADTGKISDAIVLSAVGPNGSPFEIHNLKVSNDEAGIFAAATDGSNIDLMLDLDSVRKLPAGTEATADLFVETNSGVLTFKLVASVPEPKGLTLLAVAVIGALVVRTRQGSNLASH